MFIALPYPVSIRDYRYRGCCGDMSSGFEQWKTAVKNSVMSKTSVLPMHCSVLYSFRLARLKCMRLSVPQHRTQHDNHHSAERACVRWCKYSPLDCSMLTFTRLCQCGVCVWIGQLAAAAVAPPPQLCLCQPLVGTVCTWPALRREGSGSEGRAWELVDGACPRRRGKGGGHRRYCCRRHCRRRLGLSALSVGLDCAEKAVVCHSFTKP